METVFVFLGGIAAGFGLALMLGRHFERKSAARRAVPIFTLPDVGQSPDPDTVAALDAYIRAHGSVAQAVVSLGHDRLAAMPISLFGWLMTRLALELAAQQAVRNRAQDAQAPPPSGEPVHGIKVPPEPRRKSMMPYTIPDGTTLHPWAARPPEHPPLKRLPHEGWSLDPGKTFDL